MKVLYICSSIPSVGIHHYAALLPQMMHELGKDVCVLSSPGEADPGVRQKLSEHNIKIIDFMEAEDRGIRSMWMSSRFISDVFRREEINIVHTFGFASALRCMMAQKLFPARKTVPIVVSLESLRHGMPEEFLARIIASLAFNRMPCVVCALSTIEFQKMKRAGLKKDRLKLVPNWIDIKQFDENARKFNGMQLPFNGKINSRITIIYLANFIHRKGHRYLIEAAREVVKRCPKCVFVLAGKGPLLDEMRELAADMGIEEHIVFPGRLPVEQVPYLLKHAHIGVVASLSETFGWNIVEPFLSDIPVVTTDVGFAADLNASGGAVMVPKRDPIAMAEALIHLITNPDLRRSITRKGKAYVIENCDMQNVAKRYISIYQEMI